VKGKRQVERGSLLFSYSLGEKKKGKKGTPIFNLLQGGKGRSRHRPPSSSTRGKEKPRLPRRVGKESKKNGRRRKRILFIRSYPLVSAGREGGGREKSSYFE